METTRSRSLSPEQGPACFPDAVVDGVPRTPPKSQKSSPRPLTTTPAQNSRGALKKQQESPKLRYVKPKDSGKKHHHISSFSVVDTTLSPEIAVSENTRIHKPGAFALEVVNQKPGTKSSYDAGVFENYYKPGPHLNMSDAVLRYSKEMWEKYDATFRAQMSEYHAFFREQMGEYHTSFRQLIGTVFSRNHVENAKTLNKYAENYFSFPEGGSEAAQLVMKRGTRPLKCNKKRGRHLRDRRTAAKKLWARVIVKILKKAKKVTRRKKQKEMPPSGDSQAGVFENEEVETDLRGGGDSDSESSLGESPSAPCDPLESDIEDGPIEEPPNDPSLDVYVAQVRRWQSALPSFRISLYYEEFRFVNLERISSAEQVIEAVHRGIQTALDDANVRLDPYDYVQLRLEGRNLNNPLFSVRRNKDDLSAEDFLNQASKLFKSNREVHVDGTLRFVVKAVKTLVGESVGF
ncbi:uncharacterized protein [Emydura macquarii macquarii]|uniref:uncharacterized protein n=1 Tax=Emydura macquarii macquarii TaxID=1129001 RepID=UPI00352ABA86